MMLDIELNFGEIVDLNKISNDLKIFNPKLDIYNLNNNYKKRGDDLISYIKECKLWKRTVKFMLLDIEGLLAQR